MSQAQFVSLEALIEQWSHNVVHGDPPVRYPIGSDDLDRIEVGPGLVTLLGGAPGAGKTAFAMQATIDALRLTPGVRALVCNVEMPPDALLDRQLARLSGVPLTRIRHRQFDQQQLDRLDRGIATLGSVADRLCFLRPPFDLGNVAAAADQFEASLLVLDYIQRITPPGEDAEARSRVNRTMDYLRRFADAGVAVIVISAVGRTRDGRGRSSYSGEGLNLASFRESSELEFGADDAFIIHPDQDDAEGSMVRLKHLKSRYGECRTLMLEFDRYCQHFACVQAAAEAPPSTAGADHREGLAALWDQTSPAPEEDDG